MRKIILFCLILVTSLNVKATHIMGGEITWECIKDPTSPDYGRYVFEMKVYRDCSGITFSQISQTCVRYWLYSTLT